MESVPAYDSDGMATAVYIVYRQVASSRGTKFFNHSVASSCGNQNRTFKENERSIFDGGVVVSARRRVMPRRKVAQEKLIIRRYFC